MLKLAARKAIAERRRAKKAAQENGESSITTGPVKTVTKKTSKIDLKTVLAKKRAKRRVRARMVRLALKKKIAERRKRIAALLRSLEAASNAPAAGEASEEQGNGRRHQ